MGSPPQIETMGAPHSSTAARHSSSGTRSLMVDSYSRMRPQPVQVRLQAWSGSSIITMGKRLDRCLASHLGVEVAQVGGALAVVEDAAQSEGKSAGDPQAAPGEDQGDQPPGGVGPAVEVGWCLDLGHAVLGEAAVDLFGDRRDVAGIEGRGAGQRLVPAVLPDVPEEQVEPADPGLLHAGPAGLGGDVGQVALQQRPIDVRRKH